MGIRFKIVHHPEAEKAHQFRYQIRHSNGQEMDSSEGYPTYQHALRAVRGLLKGFAKLFASDLAKRSAVTDRSLVDEVAADVKIPFTADSYKPAVKTKQHIKP